jgi:hypothetical protein
MITHDRARFGAIVADALPARHRARLTATEEKQ